MLALVIVAIIALALFGAGFVIKWLFIAASSAWPVVSDSTTVACSAKSAARSVANNSADSSRVDSASRSAASAATCADNSANRPAD